MVFMLHDVVGKEDLNNTMENALTWSHQPWLSMKPIGIDDPTFYAYEACQLDPMASAGWGELYATMTDKYNLEALAISTDHRASDTDTDSPHDSRRPHCRSRSPRRCRLTDGPRGARASGHRAPIEPDTRPDTRSSGHAPTRGSGIDRRSSKQEPSADSHPIYHDRTSDRDARTPNRGRADMPAYATLEPDATVWWDVLAELGVDDQATRMLFSLAQYNDDGRKHANSIIGKLLKGESGRKYYHTTISAFVSTAVTRARHAIEPDWRSAEPHHDEGKGADQRRRGGKANQRRRRAPGGK